MVGAVNVVVWADDSDHLPWEQEVIDVLTQPLFGRPPEHVLPRGGWNIQAEDAGKE